MTPPDPSPPSGPSADAAAPARPSRLRRGLLLGGAAVVGTAGGAWLALRQQSHVHQDPVLASGSATGASSPAAGLWGLQFDQPGGGTLAMASLRGKPLLLNFWATWCAPCVKEMPQIDRFHRDFQPQGWQVVGLAIDGPTPVRDFLARIPVGFPIGLAGFEGSELSRTLGNERGGLPFTVVFDRAGGIVQRKLGETHYEEMAGWARALG
jgi:thiol-disulfide isomerase/thioredoxin